VKRVLASALGLALLSGCAESSWLRSREQAARSRQLLLGAQVFHERCSPCHGDRGMGDGVLAEVLPTRPRNYHDEAFKWGATPQAIATTVRLGRSGIMPSFEGALQDEEIVAVSELVASWAAAGARARALRPRGESGGGGGMPASRAN
jgi:mono/diheme cytochrome c family protein